MGKRINKFLIDLAKAGAIFLILILGYFFLLSRDIKKIDEFCNEIKPGLDINLLHTIADKYDVGSTNIRNPNAVKNQSLGFKDTEKENTWVLAIAAPMTMGEHACLIYHNNHVILSSELSW